jgi:hypothetical protein
MTTNSIFVQMASYRDPELVPTLIDLIERAANPQLLRVVVCWQHAPQEALGIFWLQGFAKWRFETRDGRTVHLMEHNGATIEVIDIPHFESQGACWARHLIQQHYRGERYTLQLDSHHRFVQDWDTLIIDMLESLRTESCNPVLTAYLPTYSVVTCERTPGPLFMKFDRFTAEGVVYFKGKRFPNGVSYTQPIPARFYSGHFTFADGHFSEVVQHDPNYFFLGEEMSITVRAFTHGYDLYHPHMTVGWHNCSRKNRVTIWQDHTSEAKERGDTPLRWDERNTLSLQRNLTLFGMDGHSPSDIDFGKFGFGSIRTLAEYEAYAGISFANRAVHQTTADGVLPTLDRQDEGSDTEWRIGLRRSNEIRVCHHRNVFDQNALGACKVETLQLAASGRVSAYANDHSVLHQEAFDDKHFSKYRSAEWLDFTVSFLTELNQRPSHYILELADISGVPLTQITTQLDI